MNLRRTVMAIVVLGSLCATATAAEVTLPLTDDAFIRGDQPNTNRNTTELRVHSVGPMYSLVRFDASTIAGMTVTSATLHVYLRTILAAGQLTVYPVVSSWNEGSVTWSLRPPTEATATANVALTTAKAGTVISINVTSVAQRWANGTLADAGFLLSTVNPINAHFDSKERAPTNPATLTVDIADIGPGPDVRMGADGNGNVWGGKLAFNNALNSNLPGAWNVAFGEGALSSQTSTSGNIGIGRYAMLNNTTGFMNVAIGGEAPMGANTTGSFNTTVGNRSMVRNSAGQANAAFGHEAMWNFAGSENTSIGANSMTSNGDGSQNTALGAAALSRLSSGWSNIAIGYTAGMGLQTGSNNVLIGNSGVASESNAIRIGTTGLHAKTFVSGIYGSTIGSAGSTVVINADGQLGTIMSSARYKEDIQPMADASGRIYKLRPVTFRYKKEMGDGDKPLQYGLIAEEVAEVFPELVVYNKNGQPDTVAYHLLAAMLLNELQKQNVKVAMQEEQLVELRAVSSEVDALRAEIAELRNVSAKLVAALREQQEFHHGEVSLVAVH